MSIGEVLSAKRKAAGLTLDELSEATGIAKSQIHEMEHDRVPRPGLITCALLCLALGLDIRLLAVQALQSAKEHSNG